MSHKKKRNIIIGTLCGVLLLMIVGYAAFQSVLKIKGTSTINSNWNVHITNVEEGTIIGTASTSVYKEGEKAGQKIMTFEDTSATFSSDLQAPGDSIEYIITVTNAGTLDAKLDKITLSEPDNEYITFETSGLVENDELKAGTNKELKVKVTFKDVNINKMETSSSKLTVTLDFSQTNVDENGIVQQPKNAATFLKEKVVATGDGLYEDSTESGRYVYKGSNPNNYIQFNNELWRIIAVESDETIKIIKTESLGQKQFDTAAGRYQGSSGYCNHNKYGCNVWGSKSTMLDANGNNVTTMSRELNGTQYTLPTTESQMAIYLNNTYYKSSELSAQAKGQIDNHLWNVGVVASIQQSAETIMAEEQVNKWRGNIGLLNPSDYIKASANLNCTSGACMMNNYLKIRYYYWTMSPAFSSSEGSSQIWFVSNDFGVTSPTSAVNGTDVFPVVYLNSNIKVEGEGTTESPYIIS